jgi:hypothetical protein
LIHQVKKIQIKIMKPLLLILVLVAAAVTCTAQKKKRTPALIRARLADHGRVAGDTVYYRYGPGQSMRELERFYNRNLRMPYARDYDGMEVGSCEVHILVDTGGTISRTWCEEITNHILAKEVLRVTGKIPAMHPSTIRSKPVQTELVISFNFYLNGDTISPKKKTDIVVIGFPPVHKRTFTSITYPVRPQTPVAGATRRVDIYCLQKVATGSINR